MSFDTEDFAYPPFGGRVKLVLLGILLPAVIAWMSARAWIDEEAFWPARRGRGITVKGEAAQAMAVAYFCVALFIHARWFWGLLQWERSFEFLTVLSCCAFLGALLWAFCVV